MRRSPEDRFSGWNEAEQPSGPASSVPSSGATAGTAVPGHHPLGSSGSSSSTAQPADRETEEIDQRARWYLASVRNAVRAVMPNFRTVSDPEGPSPAEPLTLDTTHSALAAPLSRMP